MYSSNQSSNQSSPSQTKKTFKIVKNITDFDKYSVLYGISDNCQADTYINSGSFGRVYGGIRTINSVLKVYCTDTHQHADIEQLNQIANLLSFNPSAHTINIYKVVVNNKLQIIMDKCTHSLKTQLKHREKNIDYLEENLKFIDQINRGLRHLHSLGIALGKLDEDKILVKIDGNLKILKIGISINSIYSERFITNSSTLIQNIEEQLKNDMKMLAQLIIRLIWDQNFIAKQHQKNQFKPSKHTKLDKQKQNNLVLLLNSALKGNISSSEFHKKYNKEIYKAQSKDILMGMKTSQASTSASHKQEGNSDKLSRLLSSFIDASYSSNQKQRESVQKELDQPLLKIMEQIMKQKKIIKQVGNKN